MAIKSAEVIEFVRKLMTDESARFFKEPYIIRTMNMASNFAFQRLCHAREDVFLQVGEQDITQTDIDAGTTDYDLPEGTMYVSAYCTQYPHRVDYRPYWKSGETEDKPTVRPQNPLIAGKHYELTLLKFRLLTLPSSPDTIVYRYKALPTPLKKQGENFDDYPSFMFNYFVVYCQWYMEKRDEYPDPQTYKEIVAELASIRAIITNQAGRPDRLGPTWDTIFDYYEDA